MGEIFSIGFSVWKIMGQLIWFYSGCHALAVEFAQTKIFGKMPVQQKRMKRHQSLTKNASFGLQVYPLSCS